ncbi:MAG: dTDP-6-deoxy-3,4-keto-hexulose reductase [Spirochaetes bacterium GWF1_51_8]|nr:MAG: dTDP-6-deoxy-3,4-keto-hexulose reductase [Spirochaetes bacterium GWF1_51_8]
MKALIAGKNGTLGKVLTKTLGAKGYTVEGWDRSRIPIDDYARMESFVREAAPDIFYHLAILSAPTGLPNEGWKVNYEWPSETAWICRTLGIRFVFTSSVMVFTNNARGPFTPESIPDETGGYGYEKRMAEERVRSQCPESIIARLGWQIGDAPGSNNMIDYFDKQTSAYGEVRASRKWYPACSFLEDTAKALAEIAVLPPGLYQIDSNKKWNFYEIARGLSKLHGGKWKIVPTDDFVYDQRMTDSRIEIPALDTRIPGLK